MVSRAARARGIVAAAAFGGGGVTLLGAGTVGLLYLQARLAHRTVGFRPWQAPSADGVYGSGAGRPLSLVMMGDSLAAGCAVAEAAHTPAGLLATELSAVAGRPVRTRTVAAVGATSQDLPEQLARVRENPPDVAVLLIGANDVIRRVRPATAVHHLRHVVGELVEMGSCVVVGTCPDLGSVRPIARPLRYIVRRAARQLAAAQTIVVVEEGGRSVSLTDLLPTEFLTYPEVMFGPDRFHPSARGYARAMSVVLPSVCAALGVAWEPQRYDGALGERTGPLPVDEAAAEAAEESGTEVSGAEVAGVERGPRGRWASLIRWRERRSVDTAGEAAPAHRGSTVNGG